MSTANRDYILFLFFLLTLIIFAGIRPIGFDSDSLGYSNWIDYGIYHDRAEISFGLIVDFWKKFVSEDMLSRMVFISYSVINMFILAFALNNYTKEKNKALLIYFFLFYAMATLTQIRIGVASAIFFWAIYDILNKNLFTYILKMILAISFHSMALIFIPFYFLNSNKFNRVVYLLIPIVGVIFVPFTPYIKDIVKTEIVQYLPGIIGAKVYSYLSIEEQAVSTFNLWFLFYLFIYYLLIFNIEKFPKTHILYTKILGIGIILYFSTTFLSDMSVRILNSTGLLLLFLIPDISKIFKQSKIALFLLIMLSFLLFYNTLFRNSLLHMEVLFGDFVPISKKSK